MAAASVVAWRSGRPPAVVRALITPGAVIELACALGEQICPPLKCPEFKPRPDDLKVPPPLASRRTGTAQPSRSRAIACNSAWFSVPFAFGCSSVFSFSCHGLSSTAGCDFRRQISPAVLRRMGTIAKTRSPLSHDAISLRQGRAVIEGTRRAKMMAF
jgi:hypothetical protein